MYCCNQLWNMVEMQKITMLKKLCHVNPCIRKTAQKIRLLTSISFAKFWQNFAHLHDSMKPTCISSGNRAKTSYFFLLVRDASRLQGSFNIDMLWEVLSKTSLLRRMQAQALSDATPPIGQIHTFSKMTVIFEPLMGFSCSSGFRKFLFTIYFITIYTRLGVAAV